MSDIPQQRGEDSQMLPHIMFDIACLQIKSGKFFQGLKTVREAIRIDPEQNLSIYSRNIPQWLKLVFILAQIGRRKLLKIKNSKA